MPVKSKKSDRRASRTRQALSAALIELIKEKHYDAITIQNVIDRANVGRSTFYAHYRDKEDLLRSDWEKLLDALGLHLKWENVGKGRVVPVLELFSHVQDFQVFCRGLTRSRKMDSLFKSGIAYLANSIERSLIRFLGVKAQPSVPLPVLANHVAGTLFLLLSWWLDNDMPYTPERLDEIYHELVMPGLRAAWPDCEADMIEASGCTHPGSRTKFPAGTRHS